MELSLTLAQKNPQQSAVTFSSALIKLDILNIKSRKKQEMRLCPRPTLIFMLLKATDTLLQILILAYLNISLQST